MSELSDPLPADPISAVGVVASHNKAPNDYIVVSDYLKRLYVLKILVALMGLNQD